MMSQKTMKWLLKRKKIFCQLAILFIKYIFFRVYLFLERGEGRKEERERNIDVQEKYWFVASCTSPTGDSACNPGMFPDWELNWWLFGLQAGTQSSEPHQPGHQLVILHPVEILFKNKDKDIQDTWYVTASPPGIRNWYKMELISASNRKKFF